MEEYTSVSLCNTHPRPCKPHVVTNPRRPFIPFPSPDPHATICAGVEGVPPGTTLLEFIAAEEGPPDGK
jgi:hypothetical protein